MCLNVCAYVIVCVCVCVCVCVVVCVCVCICDCVCVRVCNELQDIVYLQLQTLYKNEILPKLAEFQKPRHHLCFLNKGV